MIKRVYYLEDNERMGKLLKKSISRINDVCPVEVFVFVNYKTFIEAMRENIPNIIILDLMLPNGESGLQILKELKATYEYREIPVIIVSAKVTDYDRYACLEAGAHCYFTKPFFRLEELNSSIKNFMKVPRDGSIVVCGDLVLDSNLHTVTMAGVKLDIMHKEFDLLKYFAKNNGKICSKEELYREVWKEKLPKGSRTIEQYIKAIRRKGFADNQAVIETHRGIGYRFVYNIKE